MTVAITDGQRQEIRDGFREWSGGCDPHEFCPDDGDYGYEAYAEHYSHDGVSQEDLEAFLDAWCEEGGVDEDERWAAETADPVVWTGKVGAFDVRVRRVSEQDVVAETLYDGSWCPSPEDVSRRAIVTAYLREIFTRGMPSP